MIRHFASYFVILKNGTVLQSPNFGPKIPPRRVMPSEVGISLRHAWQGLLLLQLGTVNVEVAERGRSQRCVCPWSSLCVPVDNVECKPEATEDHECIVESNVGYILEDGYVVKMQERD